MRDRIEAALAQAKRVLAKYQAEAVEKTIWGSPAGKKRLAKRLAAMLPPHKTYVEPFAGSLAVLFAKTPSAVEVVNDADPEIAEAYQLIKKLSPADLARLKKKPWVGDEQTFKALFDAQPKSDLDRLHRFLYVTHFSYGKLRSRSFNPGSAGVAATTIKRLEEFGPRLRRAHIYSGDYERVVRKYDGRATAFFLDPPYPGYNVDVGESKFDEERFFGLLKSLKGKFLITYGIRGKFPALVKSSDFWSRRIRTPRTISAMQGVGGPKVLTQLLVANYQPTTKNLGDGAILEDWDGRYEGGTREPDFPGARTAPGLATLEALEAPAALDPFAKASELLKGIDPTDERFVLGIVLEPETVDAQGDIYSAEEIRAAAHRFMEDFGGLGLMHRLRVNDQVKVLETYLAPADFSLGTLSVRKGTWLLAVRILSDAIWQQVKSGELSGFSIGGSARRTSEPAPAVAPDLDPEAGDVAPPSPSPPEESP